MTIEDISRFRLSNQHLVGEKFKTAHEVVSHLGAVQAQEYYGGLWSVGMRMESATEKEVEEEIAKKKIIRTWPMRGTIHLVPAEDAYSLLIHLTPRIKTKYASMLKKQGLSDEVFEKSAKLLKFALKGNNALTREEIYEILTKQNIPTKNMAGMNIIAILSQQAVICEGVRKGKQQTFVLFDEWIKEYNKLDKDETIANLALKYFTSHGPATIKDFMFWSGTLLAEAKLAVEAIQSKLEVFELDGFTYYMHKNSKIVKFDSPVVHLLQPFDELTISHRNYHATIDEKLIEKLKSSNMFSMFTIDGKVTGTWKRILKKDNVDFEINKFRKLSNIEENELDKAIKQYTNFISNSSK